MKKIQEINNQKMKLGKKETIKKKKKNQIKFWFKEFKRKFKNNSLYKFREKFKNVIIF